MKDPLADNTAQGSELFLIHFSGKNPKAKQSRSQQAGKRSRIQKSESKAEISKTQNPNRVRAPFVVRVEA